MSENNSMDEVSKSRPVLGDVTNRPRKRKSFLVFGDSPLKSRFDSVKNVDDNKEDSIITKKISLGVEKENWISKSAEKICEDESGGKNVASSTSEMPKEVIGCIVTADTTISVVPSDEHYVSNEGSAKADEGRKDADVVHEVLDSGNNGKDFGECSGMVKTLDSKSFGLERCSALKGNGSAGSSLNLDLIKSCSCSFCLKAGYILSDLYYQDIKGRITALNKSQKEASILVQRCRVLETDTQGHENSNKCSKLEYELMGKWKSLFLHTEDRFVAENAKLKENYVALKELRENCQKNLNNKEMPMPSKGK